MDLEKALKNANLAEDSSTVRNQFINVFKNPSKLPITQTHLERTWVELRKNIRKDLDFLELSAKDIRNGYFETKSEIIPALDKRWLPKCVLYKFEPYVFTLSEEENYSFVTNISFIESLEFLLQCNFHQFWCTILFEPTAVVSLRSFLSNPMPPYEVKYLKNEFKEIYNKVYTTFLLVFDRLITFTESEDEFIPPEYAVKKLVDKKLLNLPIVICLPFLYKTSNLEFANKVTHCYFSDTSQLDFQLKEVEDMISQSILVLEMIGGHVCGFDKDAVVIPIALEKRPPIFSLKWVYSVVTYLLNTMSTLHVLFEFYKPAMEIALNKEYPYRIPFIYVNIYKELYSMLDNRQELKLEKDLSDRIFEIMNLGRTEFIDVFHTFTSFCLDETLRFLGDTKKQEDIVETYLRLLTTALEDDYFICDYNLKYNVANQNEMFESCCPLDPTRTEFIVSCIHKLPRNKKLETLCQMNPKTIETVFKEFEPPVQEPEIIDISQPSTSTNLNKIEDFELEAKIQDIIDMFPHLGDGFVLQCLESYNFNTSDVIHGILEENLPPHLYDIPFDTIRIPPEPEPEKPKLAYKGKKPGYDDALKLLNDKSDFKQIKTFVLEGVQYSNDYLYDDEYDDRDDEVPLKVTDNPLSEDLPTSNPNHEDLASDTSYTSDDDYDERSQTTGANPRDGKPHDKSKVPFCEDPAALRERREARYRAKQPQKKTADVVGKPKGQGQEKNVLLSRQKKAVNKSSRANHNRKGGASWKRSKGMIPS